MEIKGGARRKSKREEQNRGHVLPFILSFCVVVSKHIEIIKNFGILQLWVPSRVVSVFFHPVFHSFLCCSISWFALPRMLPVYCGMDFVLGLIHFQTSDYELAWCVRVDAFLQSVAQLNPSCQSHQPQFSKTEPSNYCVEYSCQTKEKSSHKPFLFSLPVFLYILLNRIWWHCGRFKRINFTRSCNLRLNAGFLYLQSFVTMHLWSPEVVTAKPWHPFPHIRPII